MPLIGEKVKRNIVKNEGGPKTSETLRFFAKKNFNVKLIFTHTGVALTTISMWGGWVSIG